ncbi:MAG: TetR-like C-terminal domain-containing protein [Bacilli bacterium]
MTNFESKSINSCIKMENALIEILEYKDFLDITVKEICIVAKVNRTTFYAHYDNTFELLEDTKKEMINKFLSSYKDKSFEEISKNENLDLINKEYLLPYIKFIKENKNIYEVYTKNSLTLDTDEYFSNIVKYIAMPIAKNSGEKDIKFIEYVTSFYIEGINSIIRRWIKNGFKETEEYILNVIMRVRYK